MQKLAILLAFLLTLSACGTMTTEPEIESTHDSVIVALSPEAEPEAGFDPAYGWGAGEHVHEPLIQSTLTVTTSDLKIAYDLATELNCSKDGLTWTAKIRDDVFFSNDKKLTASDVAFTYNNIKTQSSVNDFTMLKNAEATDSITIIFHMEKPFSIWPYTMANVGIVPEEGYSTDYAQNPIGSGRYILKQWDRGQQVIFEANPNYYGDSPIMKKLTVLFMEEDTAFLAAKAGQVDLAYTAASYTKEKVKGYNLFSVDTVDNRGFNFPTTGNDITSDIAIRQAVDIGIDREEMITNVLDGYGTPAYSVCDKLPWYNDIAKVEYNPEKALSILEEAGWKIGKDNIREKNGISATLTLLYPIGDSIRQALAADFGNQLKSLGIKTICEGVGWDTAYTRALSEPLIWGWGAHTPIELYNIYYTAEYSPYSNPTVNKYMDEALSADNLEKSYELWKKAQWDGNNGITADLPWIWLVNINHLYWSRSNLQIAEQKIHPHGHGWSIVNNVDKWSWT